MFENDFNKSGEFKTNLSESVQAHRVSRISGGDFSRDLRPNYPSEGLGFKRKRKAEKGNIKAFVVFCSSRKKTTRMNHLNQIF